MLGEKQQDIKFLCHNYNLSMNTPEYFEGTQEGIWEETIWESPTY